MEGMAREEDSSKPGGRKRFGCPLCSSSFARKDYVSKHAKRVHLLGASGRIDRCGQKCDECGQEFSCQSKFVEHLREKHPSCQEGMVNAYDQTKRAQRRKRNLAYRRKNPTKVKEVQRAYRKRHRALINEAARRRYSRNRRRRSPDKPSADRGRVFGTRIYERIAEGW